MWPYDSTSCVWMLPLVTWLVGSGDAVRFVEQSHCRSAAGHVTAVRSVAANHCYTTVTATATHSVTRSAHTACLLLVLSQPPTHSSFVWRAYVRSRCHCRCPCHRFASVTARLDQRPHSLPLPVKRAATALAPVGTECTAQRSASSNQLPGHQRASSMPPLSICPPAAMCRAPSLVIAHTPASGPSPRSLCAAHAPNPTPLSPSIATLSRDGLAGVVLRAARRHAAVAAR